MGRGKTTRVEILSGWKEIANYLGKGVRTVQRYERELGLPVRRPVGHVGSSVIATKAELDGWIAAIPIREAYGIPVRYSAPSLRTFHENVETLHTHNRRCEVATTTG